jgi:hypothetical protein
MHRYDLGDEVGVDVEMFLRGVKTTWEKAQETKEVFSTRWQLSWVMKDEENIPENSRNRQKEETTAHFWRTTKHHTCWKSKYQRAVGPRATEVGKARPKGLLTPLLSLSNTLKDEAHTTMRQGSRNTIELCLRCCGRAGAVPKSKFRGLGQEGRRKWQSIP